MIPHRINLECIGPFSFFDNLANPRVALCEHANGKGVYLWALPIEGTYRVNYAGKTSNRAGFSQRFAQELRFAQSGKSSGGKTTWAPIVDCDLWFQGKRVETNKRPTAEENAAAWPEMERTYRALHIFLIPIDGNDLLRTRVESAIAHHLWNECDACRRFMCRPTQSRGAVEGPPLSIELQLPDGIEICGLSGSIHECISSRPNGR